MRSQKRHLTLAAAASAVLMGLFGHQPAQAQGGQKAAPVFRDGQAQVVPAFEDPSSWIREELWVETEFDSDGDGQPDRVHVAVARPAQTETEGLKVPVIYESSRITSRLLLRDMGMSSQVVQCAAT